MDRAYSLIEVKAVTEEDGYYVVSGMATTPAPDRMSDIVEPLGAKFAEVIPLLWQHMSDKPVGEARLGRPTKSGIPFTARLPIVTEAGALKDRIDEAVQSIKYKLVAAVSIGFRVLNDAYEILKDGGLRFLEIEIMELSLVTIPANAQATINLIKSIDTEQRAAFLRKTGSVKLLVAPNEEAVISTVNSADQKALSAVGHGRNKAASEIRPGDAGKKRRPIQLIPRK